MVTQCAQSSHTRTIAAYKRRPQVRGVFPNYIQQRLFITDDLVAACRLGEGGEVEVGPCVRGDLVPFVEHALNYAAPLRGCVDGAFVEVVAADEEGGFYALGGEEIEDGCSVGVGTVVEGSGGVLVGVGAGEGGGAYRAMVPARVQASISCPVFGVSLLDSGRGWRGIP